MSAEQVVPMKLMHLNAYSNTVNDIESAYLSFHFFIAAEAPQFEYAVLKDKIKGNTSI